MHHTSYLTLRLFLCSWVTFRLIQSISSMKILIVTNTSPDRSNRFMEYLFRQKAFMTILDEICKHKLAEVAENKKRISVEELKNNVKKSQASRRFGSALNRRQYYYHSRN